MRRTSSAKGKSQCSNLTKTALRILLSFEHFGPFFTAQDKLRDNIQRELVEAQAILPSEFDASNFACPYDRVTPER